MRRVVHRLYPLRAVPRNHSISGEPIANFDSTIPTFSLSAAFELNRLARGRGLSQAGSAYGEYDLRAVTRMGKDHVAALSKAFCALVEWNVSQPTGKRMERSRKLLFE